LKHILKLFTIKKQIMKEKSSSSSNGKSTAGAAQNGSSRKSSSKASLGKKGSPTENGLRELYEDMIKDIYWAEKALTKALPNMQKKATSQELKDALQEHVNVTEEQVQRLDEVFKIMGKAARAKKCLAMEGLIKEAEEIIDETEEGIVRDAWIIAACQKVEHYEIATYGTLVALAKTLGEDEAGELFAQTLAEEKEADQVLTDVAEGTVTTEGDEAQEME
jgi:ferritin-like metal-binding protein YciE